MESTLVLERDCIADPTVWKNLMFLKDGRSLLGYHTFPTEDAARAVHAAGATVLRDMVLIHHDFRIINTAGKHLYYAREYSHSIPIQVRT